MRAISPRKHSNVWDPRAVQCTTVLFAYDDGTGKTVRSSDIFALSADETVLVWDPADGKRAPSRFSVQQISGGNTFTLVVEMNGEDDNRTARIRETLTVDASELRILKEVQFTADAPWVFRHEYRLRRSRR